MNKRLPMGCSLSCYNFEVFSSSLEWEVAVSFMQGGHTQYYTLLISFSRVKVSLVYSKLLDTFVEVCSDFWIPLTHDKTRFPITEIDLMKGEFRLLFEK